MYVRRSLPSPAAKRSVGALRHDMSPRLFSALLFLLLMCCVCGLVRGRQVRGQRGVDLFVPGATKIPSTGNKRFKSFESPSLVEADGMIIAFAEASETGTGDPFVDIVEAHTQLKGGDIVGAANTWTKNIVVTNKKGNENFQYPDPTAVVNGKKIFVYFTNQYKGEGGGYDYQLVVGEVDGKSKTITWDPPISLTKIFEEAIEDVDDLYIFGGGGSGIVTKNQTLVLPMMYTANNDPFVPTIIYSVDDGKNWTMVPSTLPEDCSPPAVVEWRDKLLMMTPCYDDRHKVFESSDMGRTWTEAVGTLSQAWGKTEKLGLGPRPGLITANIGGKDVMLLALLVKTETHRYLLHLWLTDGSRIYDVGRISADRETVISSTLLYAKENLFVAYEKGSNKNTRTIHIAHLDNELKEIRRVLGVWAERDASISNVCATPGLKPTPAGKACATRMPTDGLVGFLSGDGDGSHWRDEYLCVNATVTKGTRVAGGFNFSGPGEGAQWPVGEQGLIQRYHFANYGFTLVATVFIHSAPEGGDSPLLGVAVNGSAGNTVLFGLSCSADRKWVVKTGTEGKSFGRTTWEIGRQYQVALVFQSGRGSVYVDWRLLGGENGGSAKKTDSEEVQHFYFGAGGEGGKGAVQSHVTVTNVFLYNRPFEKSEIQTLGMTTAVSNPQDVRGAAHGKTNHKDSAVHAPVGIALLLGLLGLALLSWTN